MIMSELNTTMPSKNDVVSLYRVSAWPDIAADSQDVTETPATTPQPEETPCGNTDPAEVKKANIAVAGEGSVRDGSADKAPTAGCCGAAEDPCGPGNADKASPVETKE